MVVHVAPFVGLLAMTAVACTGEPVGEIAADAGGSGGNPDASTTDGGGAGGSTSAAEVLAAGRDCPADFRVVAGTVTWVDQGSLQNSANDGLVATMPAAGCADDSGGCVTLLAENQRSPAAVEVEPESGDVYWTSITDGTLWRLPSQSKTPVAFAVGQSWPRWLALDDSVPVLFWVNSGQLGAADGEVRGAYLDEGTPGGAVLAAGLDSPIAITAHIVSLGSTKIFWTNDGTTDTTGYVMAADSTGAGAQQIAGDQSHPRGIAANANHVFWTNTGDGSLMRATHSGSEVDRLLSELATPSDVAVDASGLYWVEAGTPIDYADGKVMAAKLDGSGAVTLATGERDPRRIALDGTHVYWLSRGSQGVQKCAQHDGRVMRVKKPW